MFRVEGIETQFGLKIQDFRVAKEGVTFIIGKSGIGKSISLKLFNRTASVQRGRVYYQDRDITQWDPIQLRREVLLVSQMSYLKLGSIRENFEEFRKFRSEKDLSESEMKNFLSLCSINLEVDTLTQNLSGGEKHRVYIAIFLSFMPKVLLIDEPTAALDEKTGDEVMKSISKFSLENGIKLIVVSHEMSLANKYATEMVEMKERAL